jgi:hypothetical protein
VRQPRGRARRAVLGAAAVLALLGAAGCGGKETVRPDVAAAPPVAGPKVAVAPMANLTNDLSASDIVRLAFVDGVARRGYVVVPVAESDARLRETLGISYGGQLGATTPAEVCAALGVDGVFYGEVQEFSKTTTGIYNSVAAAAGFRLFAKDGTLRWQGNDRQARQDIPHGGQNLGAEIVVNALGNLLLNPMTPYGKRVGWNIARKVPAGLLDNVAK